MAPINIGRLSNDEYFEDNKQTQYFIPISNAYVLNSFSFDDI